MIVACPKCDELLTPTETGAVCAAGHGGVFGGVKKRDIEAERKRRERELRPLATKLIRGYYTVAGREGIWTWAWSGELLCRVGNGQGWFSRDTKFEDRMRVALNGSPTGEAKE